MPKKVVIVGAGPGGYVAALRGAQLGLEVTLVEKRFLGGVCLNVGCIPTKALLASADAFVAARSGDAYGFRVEGEVVADFAAMAARKDRIVKRLTGGVGSLLAAAGVEVVMGEAALGPDRRVTVRVSDGGERAFQPDAVVLATGSEPARPGFFPIDEERVLTSDGALALAGLPESLIVVGGGYIGMEFASLFSDLGVRVTVVEMLPRILPTADAEVASALAGIMTKRGVRILTGTKVESVDVGSSGVAASVAGERLEAEAMLVAVGRVPNSAGLEAAGLGLDERGFVRVNDRMETGVPGVYAVGDLVGGALLAHKASAEGIVAVERIAGRDSRIDYRVLPSAVFTRPEVASVGLTEEQAAAEGRAVKVGRFPFLACGKAVASGDTEGFVKLVTDSDTGEILGCHILGRGATELVAEAALAMSMEGLAADIARTIHAHPTLPEALMEAAHDALGGALHMPRRR